jgi:hypothetical protein
VIRQLHRVRTYIPYFADQYSATANSFERPSTWRDRVSYKKVSAYPTETEKTYGSQIHAGIGGPYV